MVEEASEVAAPRPRRSRRRMVALVIALLLLVFFLVLWLVRKPVAEGFIDRELARRGVPARYTIADLGLGRQRLTGVVIGDPAHPDLIADWIETATGVGTSGPFLVGVRAGHVRVRARLVDGRLSLGTIDRLLPAPSGRPFALPKIDLAVADARVRLETPAGPVGVKLAGAGRLDDGFRGAVALVAPVLVTGGCRLGATQAALRIGIANEQPHLAGPVRARIDACGGLRGHVAAAIDVTFGPALDRWDGRVVLADTMLAGPGDAAVARLAGTIGLAGDAAATTGTLDLIGDGVTAGGARARRVAVTGAYHAGVRSAFEGRVRAGGAAVPVSYARQLAALPGSAAGTPVAPLVDTAARAMLAASRDFGADADVALRYAAGQGAARVTRIAATSRSGARLMLTAGSGAGGNGNGNGVAFGWPTGGVRIDATLALAGGGLPQAQVALSQATAGAPVRGTATIAPYAAGGARLVLTPVTFEAGRGGTRVATRATLSGPLGDGRVEGLTLPVAARWDGGGGLIVNAGCAPLSFQALAVAGLRLSPARLALCPVDGALLRIGRGRIGGGARLAAVRLAGRLGTTPVTLDASGAAVQIGTRGFVVEGLRTRLGAPERATRLDVARLDGRFVNGAVAGRFAGGAGQIGNVPLLLSAAAGDWTMRGGRLALTGGLTVADAAAQPRFQPLAGTAVALTLANGAIHATGTLVEPTRQMKVADVTIDHRLGDGSGGATIAVPGIAFTKDFQPELLTRLTFGVIAEVRGDVSGSGRIDWNPDGVTSTGDFGTDGLDLAAAFGPVTGIATRIRFTDLLALQSAPGQIATVKTINPGIAVDDGRIRYQTLAGARVQVEGGVWPFADGTLTLDPTLLDFSQAAERRMTFTVAGMAADRFLQQFEFKNLDATGVFDGVLPMIFDAGGGRVEGGHLTVRAGGGSLAYVGDISQKDVGFWGNLAFGALKSLRYRDLTIAMNGPLAGEMITEVRFAGISQGQGAKSNFLIHRLQRLPFVFNIRIRAPFRGLIDSAQSFYDPRRLIQRNLPTLLEEQNKAAAAPATPVQPPASETMP